MIGVGVHILYIYVCRPKKFESYFSDRLTFSNIRGRNSHQIYRLARPLLSPEILSSLSKLRIFFLMRTMLYLFEGWQSLNSIGKYRYLVNRPWNLPLSTIPSPLADQTTSRIVEECECEKLHLRRSSPLVCGVMCSVNSSFKYDFLTPEISTSLLSLSVF